MRAPLTTRRRRALLAAAPLALVLALGGCGGDDNDNAPTPTPSTPATGTPTPTQAPRNVSACLSQPILPATATSLAVTVPNLILPDTLKLDFTRPESFPNGRRFNDPVIDLELAALLLDTTRAGQGVGALVGALNPPPPSDNAPDDAPFPFVGPATGGQPQPGTATTFNFRDDPESAYVRVDRMGNPAIATALIGATSGTAGLPLKNAFNDADPADDLTQVFVPEAVRQLQALHGVLVDDLQRLNLVPCSTAGG